MNIFAESGLFGIPLEYISLAVACFSLLVSLSALAWQVVKHVLDGGRVRVSFNAAIWEPDFSLTTNDSGRLSLKNDDQSKRALLGGALELAQLVVENPGRMPVTVHSPSISLAGHGIRNHSMGPKIFRVEPAFGSDETVSDSVVRLEPYSRITFLLDWMPVAQLALQNSRNKKNRVYLRGQVHIAGKRRPQRSRRHLRWKVDKNTYTAIEGSPNFTPFAIIWSTLFRSLPSQEEAKRSWGNENTWLFSREHLSFFLRSVMGRFSEAPSQVEFDSALTNAIKEQGCEIGAVFIRTDIAFQALDQMQGHLTEWRCGI